LVATGLATVTALVLLGDSPALAVSSWESRQVEVGIRESDSLSGVSCPTTSLCVAIGSRGTIVTSGNPHGWFPSLPAAVRGSRSTPSPESPARAPISALPSALEAWSLRTGIPSTSRRPAARKGAAPQTPSHEDRAQRQLRQAITNQGRRKQGHLPPSSIRQGPRLRLQARQAQVSTLQSPLRIYAKVGSHVLRARAIGVTGLKVPVAKHRFKIRGPRSGQSRSSDSSR